MKDPVYSVQSVSKGLTEAFHHYLEAQYHIWNETLIAERSALFNTPGETVQQPAIEATPFYRLGETYRSMNIPQRAKEILTKCAELGVAGVFETPFTHQQQALEQFLTHQREIVVATGTGSGKTESFLLPLLSKLALESSTGGQTANLFGCRAILLYPMNALVNDQLGRLRRLFGDERVSDLIKRPSGRRVTFGVYTSRTPYPGPRSKKKDGERLGPLIQKQFLAASNQIRALLTEKGKWPAKDLADFVASGYSTARDDRELFTRHEMQATCPDLLVTNYSMLEYMLIRPIERTIFEQTRNRLAADPESTLTVILDEAHMYRGAAGAEVALLLRRLQSRLQVSRDRIRFILTSASLGSSDAAEAATLKFAGELTGHERNAKPFVLIRGHPDIFLGGSKATPGETEALSAFNFSVLHRAFNACDAAVQESQQLLRSLNLGEFKDPPKSIDTLQEAIYDKLETFGPARRLSELVTGKPRSFHWLAEEVCQGPEASSALESLLALSSFARRKRDSRVFLPVRMHLLFRGLSGIFACINPKCTERRAGNADTLLGRLYGEGRLRCGCGGRIYELLTHRDCGAAYIRGYVRGIDGDFLWHEPGMSADRDAPALLEMHLLVEPSRALAKETSEQGAFAWIHIPTGRLVPSDPQHEEFLPVLRPIQPVRVHGRQVLSFDRTCVVCSRGWADNQTKIMDLATKGDAPFAHLVKQQVRLQPATCNATSQKPNAGRKSLLFSDGRQKAARLARDIPREVEQDVFRQVLVLAAQRLGVAGKPARLHPAYIYTAFIAVLAETNLRLFDGEAQDQLVRHIDEYRREDFADLNEAIDNFSRSPPPAFNERLLRQLGSPFYSLSALTLAYVVPTARALRQFALSVQPMGLSADDAEAIAVIWIDDFLDQMAFDSQISAGVRARANGFNRTAWGIVPGKPKRRLQRVAEIYGNAEGIEQKFLETLATSAGGYFFLIPDKLEIRLAVQSNWLQCERCTALTAKSLRGNCPHCEGKKLQELTADESDYLRARKKFWRDPVIAMLDGLELPFNISVEEHTAQLSYRDRDDPASTTEEFERRFQDIFVNANEFPVDVLSSTTTMEVGVDIGSLVAVGLRNVPPMRQNYQQRAGRAGRRGSSISSVLTYAQNNPHDSHYFSHPEQVIAGDPPLPEIDIRNERIIARHANAAVLQAFFHARTHDMPPTSNLFTVLGTTEAFYGADPQFSLGALAAWLASDEVAAATVSAIDKWLPEDCPYSAHQLAEAFLEALEEARPAGSVGSDLLDHLFAKGLLPSYAFPRDICALQIERREPNAARGGIPTVKVVERPQQAMNIALSEYSPYRLVVVNKKTYRVRAVTADMASTEVNRAVPLFDRARKYVHCEDCLYIQGHSDRYEEGRPCPLCGGRNVHAIDVIQPEVVFPELVDELDDEQVFTEVTAAELPVPEGDDVFQWRDFGTRSLYVHAPKQTLIMVNKGDLSDEGHSGFSVCEKCGAATLPELLVRGPHKRHYLVDGQRIAAQCDGEYANVYLGYTFISDIFLLRIDLRPPLNLSLHDRYARKPLEDALLSLSEAIALSACRALDIDQRELNAGTRFVKLRDGMAADIFLYDTSSGGAGYSNMAGQQFHSIFAAAREVLTACDCDSSCHKCLRHYGNRRDHQDLHRFLALDLWEYVAHGTTPPIPDIAGQREWLRPLVGMLGLAGWGATGTADIPVVVDRDGVRRTLGCYPALIDPSAAGHPLTGSAVLVSKYELEKNLPGAFVRVQA